MKKNNIKFEYFAIFILFLSVVFMMCRIVYGMGCVYGYGY